MNSLLNKQNNTKFKYENVLTDLSYVNYFADPVLWFFLLKVPNLWRVMFPVQSHKKSSSIFAKYASDIDADAKGILEKFLNFF